MIGDDFDPFGRARTQLTPDLFDRFRVQPARADEWQEWSRVGAQALEFVEDQILVRNLTVTLAWELEGFTRIDQQAFEHAATQALRQLPGAGPQHYGLAVAALRRFWARAREIGGMA